MTGGAFGVGAEWAFLPKWSLKFEYLYYNLGSVTNVTTPGGRDIALVAAGTIAPYSNRFSETGNIVRVGLNYRFDWALPVVAKY
jgi:outer membrane immunogenic protein